MVMTGKMLRNMRVNLLGWTQRQLADALGMTTDRISQLERGGNNIHLQHQTELAVRYIVLTQSAGQKGESGDED